MTEIMNHTGDNPALQKRVWLEQCSNGHALVQWVTTAEQHPVCPVCAAVRLVAGAIREGSQEEPGKPEPAPERPRSAAYPQDYQDAKQQQAYWEDALNAFPSQEVLRLLARALHLAADNRGQYDLTAAMTLRQAAELIRKQQGDTADE